MRIVRVEGLLAHCEARGETRQVSLLLYPEATPAPGSLVMVQGGHARRPLSEAEGAEAWALYDLILGGDAAPASPEGA